MHITFLTLFPEMFPGSLAHSVIGNALTRKLWDFEAINIRNYAHDKHQRVDETPCGGGAGMVMKPNVVSAAIDSALFKKPQAKLIYLSPRGKPLTQTKAEELSQESSLILLCGRYEGIDQRVIDHHEIEEISIGDYILAGGEVAALALSEAVLRLVPKVLGEELSIEEESFSTQGELTGLLEYPHYTRPTEWNGLEVPEVLLSGHHEKIKKWRKLQAEHLTKQRRPDMWHGYEHAQTTAPKDLED